VFSDDIEWVAKNFNFLTYPVTYVDHNSEKKSSYDLYIMSLCKHNIIANSSFSWWGAWLNQNSNKIVICPKNWFKNKEINIEDLIPTSWIKI
jgi:hypothetical protein